MKNRMKLISVVLAMIMMFTSIIPFGALASDDLLDFGSQSPETQTPAGSADNNENQGNGLEFYEDVPQINKEGNSSPSTENEDQLPEDVQKDENTGNENESGNGNQDNNTQQSDEENNSTPSEGEGNTVPSSNPDNPDNTEGVNNNEGTPQDPAGSENNEQQDAPAPAEENIPVPETISEPEVTQVDFNNTIADSRIQKVDNTTVKNGDAVEYKVELTTGMSLDKLRVVLRPSNLDLTSVEVESNENGNTFYSVYKLFHVDYEENGKAESKYIEAPVAENENTADNKKIGGLGKEYAEFESAIQDAQAQYAGESYIDIMNVAKSTKITLTVKGVVNSPEKETVSLSVAATGILGGESGSVSVGTSKYEYEEEIETDEPEKTDNTENPENANNQTNPEENQTNNPEENIENPEENKEENKDEKPEDKPDETANIPAPGRRTLMRGPLRSVAPGTVIVSAIDYDTQEPIKNVIFSASKDEDTIEFITEEDGKASRDDMAPGSYTFTVKSVPNEYQNPNYSEEKLVSSGETTNVEIELKKKPAVIQVEAYEKELHDPVKDVVFTISQGSETYDLTTEDNGTASKEVPAGTYGVTVKSVPEIYKMPNFAREVTLTNGKTENVPVELEENVGELEVSAFDDATSDPVKDVVFTVSKGEDSFELTTGDDGTASKALALGTYNVTITSVPENYQTPNYSEEKTITGGSDPVTASVRLKEYTGSFKVVACDKVTEDPIKDVVFALNNDDYSFELTTGEDGTYTKKMPSGTYTVTIKSVPEDYQAPESYSEEKAVKDGETTETEVKLTKKPVMTTITLTVLDDTTEEPIEGVILVAKPTADPEADEIKAETGADGIAVIDCMSGEYTLSLSNVPSDYIDPEYSKVVTVPAEGYTDTVRLKEYPGTLIVGAYVEGTEDPVKDVVFTISQGEDSFELTTGEMGTAAKKLPTGIYNVTVKSVPDDYQLPNYSVEKAVAEGDPAIVKVGLTEYPGSIKVVASDNDTDDPVASVVFTVSNNDHSYDLTTGDEGTYTKKIPSGTYTVTIKSVPEDYQAPESYSEEKAVKDGETTEAEVKLTKKPIMTTITLTVLDDTTEEPIEGVILVAKPTADPEADEIKAETGADGIAVIDCMSGEYTLSLSNVPSDYVDPEYSKVVTVPAEGYTDTVRLTPIPLDIVTFTGLAFDPEEQEIVPTSNYTVSLDNYFLELNKPEATVGHVRFKVAPIDSSLHMRALFDGTVTGYKVNAIINESEIKTIWSESAAAGETCTVDFDSDDLPYIDPETWEVDPEKAGGTFPAGTCFVWIDVYNPSVDFAVNTFTVSGETDVDFEEKVFTATTTVFLSGKDPMPEVSNTGKITKCEPTGTLTLDKPESIHYIGDDIRYVANFENISPVVYTKLELIINVNNDFVPESLYAGSWVGYDGTLSIYTLDNEDNRVLAGSLTPGGAIGLNTSPIKGIVLVTDDACNTDVRITNAELKGLFNHEGTAEVWSEINGEVHEGVDPLYVKTDTYTTEIVAIPPEPQTTGIVIVTALDDSNNPVKGVKFTVKEAEGEISVDMVTGEDGKASRNFNVGKYEVLLDKSSVPEKYEEPEVIKWPIEVKEEVPATANLVLTEKHEEPVVKTGKLVITAGEEETGIPVPGVEIALFKDSVKIGSGKTLDDGKLIIDDVIVGNYLIAVTAVPAGYEESTFEAKAEVKENETTNVLIPVKKTAEPTPTPTPTPGPDPEPPHGGGGGGGDVPTPEPDPEEEPLYLDNPKITSNTSSVAYGNDALFYIRGLDAFGMVETDYYVLHLMIPEGMQVKTVSFPGFGADARVTLSYSSGTTQLGVYNGPGTENLTDRQGTGLRYIAFQIHGSTQVAATGDIQLLVKDISARDRIVTLQAILSLRDSSTTVISDALNQKGQIKPKRKNIPEGMTAQKADRYNVSLAGPKSSGGSSGSSPVSTGGNSPEDVTVTERSKVCYPQMIRPSKNAAVSVKTIHEYKTRTHPLLSKMSSMKAMPIDINTERIAEQPVTDELILSRHMNLRKQMLDVFVWLSKKDKENLLR